MIGFGFILSNVALQKGLISAHHSDFHPFRSSSNFAFFLADFGKALCLSAKELQQNSNAFSREEYIPQILTVLLHIHRLYI